MKYISLVAVFIDYSPSSHGEGGLKYGMCVQRPIKQMVPPHTGRVD